VCEELIEIGVIKKSRDGLGCFNCANWLPHAHYPFAGYCTVWGEVTFEDYYCSRHARMNVDADRFYWCATCKVRLTREDALTHWTLGHRIVRGAYVDPDVRDEIYEG
jgi:hypothetical protein